MRHAAAHTGVQMGDRRGRKVSDGLKIWHVLRAPVGGLFRHVEDLAAAQARAGHRVGVICDAIAKDRLTHDRLQRLSACLALGLVQIPMARQLSHRDLLAYRKIVRLTGSSGADILHGHGAKGGAFARLAAGALKRRGHAVRAFYTPHGGSLHYDPRSMIGRLYLGLERRLERHTDGIVFESAYSARIYKEKVGDPACAVAIVPNGLHEHEFAAVVPTDTAADILFIGELRALKGVDVLIDAIAALSRQRPAAVAPMRALIVGDGPDAARFKAQADALGLSRHIRFPGAMPAAQAFPLGRCLVVPSRAESFPYIVLEAAARAIPLIATHVGGIPEIVAGSDVPLIGAEDAGALTAMLSAFLEDPAPFEARAQRLKTLAARRFTVPAMSAAVLELYQARRLTANAGYAPPACRPDAAAGTEPASL